MSHARIFLCFKTSPEITLLALMMYVRFPLSLRNVEDLHKRGIDATRETARFWRDRSGAIFAAEIRRNRVEVMRDFQHRCWPNNRAQYSHQPFRKWERAMLRRLPRQVLREFKVVHRSRHIHRYVDRLVTYRQTLKDRRDAAHAEARKLCVA